MIEDPLGILPYNDEQTLYRAATGHKWIKSDGSVRRQAFYRRMPPNDRHGLSCSPFLEHCRDGLREKTYGTVTITVRNIRRTNLEAIPDTPTHGNIVGMPDREGEDRARHDFIAQTLADLARSLPE